MFSVDWTSSLTQNKFDWNWKPFVFSFTEEYNLRVLCCCIIVLLRSILLCIDCTVILKTIYFGTPNPSRYLIYRVGEKFNWKFCELQWITTNQMHKNLEFILLFFYFFFFFCRTNLPFTLFSMPCDLFSSFISLAAFPLYSS